MGRSTAPGSLVSSSPGTGWMISSTSLKSSPATIECDQSPTGSTHTDFNPKMLPRPSTPSVPSAATSVSDLIALRMNVLPRSPHGML
jgi:hypothetical protein